MSKEEQETIIKRCLSTSTGKIVLSQTFIEPILSYLEEEIDTFTRVSGVYKQSVEQIEFMRNPVITFADIQRDCVDSFSNMVEKLKHDLKSDVMSLNDDVSEYEFSLDILPADEIDKVGYVVILRGFRK